MKNKVLIIGIILGIAIILGITIYFKGIYKSNKSIWNWENERVDFSEVNVIPNLAYVSCTTSLNSVNTSSSISGA